MNIPLKYYYVIGLLGLLIITTSTNAESMKAHIDPDTGEFITAPVEPIPTETMPPAVKSSSQMSQRVLPDGTIMLMGGPFMSNIHADVDEQGKVNITHTQKPPIN